MLEVREYDSAGKKLLKQDFAEKTSISGFCQKLHVFHLFLVILPQNVLSLHSNKTFSYSSRCILQTFQLHQIDTTDSFHATVVQK